MQVIVNGKTTNGVPTTDVVADLTGLLTDDGVRYTQATLWGPIDATVRLTADVVAAYDIAQSWLGNPVTIYTDAGDWCWEGRIWSVTYGAGGRKRTRTLDGYSNLSRLLYDEVDATTDPPTVTTADKLRTSADLAGIALYGRIGYFEHVDQLTIAEGLARVARIGADRSRISYLPSGGTLGEVSTAGAGIVELYCVGWYRYLFGRVNIQVHAAGTVDATTMIETVISGLTDDSILSTDYTQMQDTGTQVKQQWMDHEDAGTIVKKVITTVTGWTFGFGPNRVPYVRSDGKSDTAATYVELANGQIQDAVGGDVLLSTVRPGCILRQADMVPASAGFSSTVLDNIESVYLAETTFQSPGRLTYKATVRGTTGSVNPV